jgi:uncharacterized protein (TIGR03067 family)
MLSRLAVLVTTCLLAGCGSTSTSVVGHTPVAGDAPEDAFKKELKALAGTWRPVSIETDGSKVPEERLKELTMTRDENGKVTVRRGDTVVLEGTVKTIDASKKPKTMDVEQTAGEHKGKIIQGIYEIDGDTLRACVVLPGKGERPTEFSAKAGSGCSVAVYKREKK